MIKSVAKTHTYVPNCEKYQSYADQNRQNKRKNFERHLSQWHLARSPAKVSRLGHQAWVPVDVEETAGEWQKSHGSTDLTLVSNQIAYLSVLWKDYWIFRARWNNSFPRSSFLSCHTTLVGDRCVTSVTTLAKDYRHVWFDFALVLEFEPNFRL